MVEGIETQQADITKKIRAHIDTIYTDILPTISANEVSGNTQESVNRDRGVVILAIRKSMLKLFPNTPTNQLEVAADSMYSMMIEFATAYDYGPNHRDVQFKLSDRAKELIVETFALNRRNQAMKGLADHK